MIKKIIIGAFQIAAMICLPQMGQAQGTVFISNLSASQAAAGDVGVGSNSWFAMSFVTGSNVGGYALDSVQLEMTNASGNPGGFILMLYSAVGSASDFAPGSSLGALSGSANPSNSGIYIYTPVSSLTLSSLTAYFLVLTAGTDVQMALTDGAFPTQAIIR